MTEQPVTVGSSDLPDSQLLHRYVAAGAADAFAVLVRRHERVVYHVCRVILGNSADADDAFQATFLVLVRRAGSVRRTDALGSWLCGVATRVSLRAKGRRGRLFAREVGVAAVGDPLDRFPARSACHAGDHDEWAAVTEELGRLPEKYRAPLVLCYLEGLTTTEAAVRLGWSVGTFKSRLAKARELMRSQLARRGLALTAVAIAALLAASTASAEVPPPLTNAAVGLAMTAGSGATRAVAALAGSTLRTMRSPSGVLWRTCSGAAAALVLAGAVVVAIGLGSPPLSPRGAAPAGAAAPPPVGNAKPARNADPNDLAAQKAPPALPKPGPDAAASAAAPASSGLFFTHSPATRKT